jgi:deoxyribonuclease-1-like protein
MNVHIRPSYVVEEVTALKKVVNDHKLKHQINDIAILGDFNFDCGYCSFTKREQVRAEFPDFRWFIRDSYKTTIASTDCAYDRIMVTGSQFINAVVPNSNQTFRYDFQYNLSPTQVKFSVINFFILFFFNLKQFKG